MSVYTVSQINQKTQSRQSVDVSIIFPTMNEGENVLKVLDEIYAECEKLNLTFEVLAINVPTSNSSYPAFVEYSKTHKNFYGIDLAYKLPAGSGKSLQYMIGFSMAQGKYIVQMDSDGQDNPADLSKFIQKLDEGFDLVVGHKQKRKDGKVYMLTSKISNTLTPLLTGVKVHDMNCGFKGYQAHVAKSLNLKGRNYRYIPALVKSFGGKITEVPIENRKREWGKTNFSFFNRMQGGVFDLLITVIMTRSLDTPMYFFGWMSVLAISLSCLFALAAAVLNYYGFTMLSITSLLLFANFGLAAIISTLIGISSEFRRAHDRSSLDHIPVARTTFI